MTGARVVELGTFTLSVVLEVSRRTGVLTDAGLEVVERPVPSSPAQFRSLIDGKLHVALTSPDNVLAYRFDPHNPLGELVNARILAGVDRGLGLGIWARPGTEVEDLRGARGGVDVPDSGFALALFTLLERRGLGRDDYEVVKLGSTPRRLQALLDGECAVTMLGAGIELAAEAAGCTLIATVRDELRPYLATAAGIVVASWPTPATAWSSTAPSTQPPSAPCSTSAATGSPASSTAVTCWPTLCRPPGSWFAGE